MRGLRAPVLAAVLICAVAAVPTTAQTPAAEGPVLTLVGPDGQTATIRAADLEVLPRTTVVVDHAGRRTRFEGARLGALLAKVGAPTGAPLKGPAVALVVLALGADGYRAALGPGEADGGLRADPVIVADRADGAPLQADGPFRLVVGGDLRPARSVRNLVSLEVRRLPPR